MNRQLSVFQVTGRWYVSLSDPDSARTIKPSQRDVTLLPDGHLLDAVVSLRHGSSICSSESGKRVKHHGCVQTRFCVNSAT